MSVSFCIFLNRVHQNQRIKERATVIQHGKRLLAQQNTVQWFVLLVHFRINKRPDELKMNKGENGEVKDRKESKK